MAMGSQIWGRRPVEDRVVRSESVGANSQQRSSQLIIRVSPYDSTDDWRLVYNDVVRSTGQVVEVRMLVFVNNTLLNVSSV